MRTTLRTLLLLACAAAAIAAPARAQTGSAAPASQTPDIDPCTGKPYAARPGTASGQPGSPSSATPGAGPGVPGMAPSTTSAGRPGASAGTPSASAGVPGMVPSTTSPGRPGAAPSSGTPAPNAGVPGMVPSTTGGQGVPGMVPSATPSGQPGASAAQGGGGVTPSGGGDAALYSNAGFSAGDPEQGERNRSDLRLGASTSQDAVRLGPAASVSVPTAFGVDAGEVFVGAAYQGRTRYTKEDDAAAVVGIGLGTRRLVAVELALTSFSTLRGGPLETGGLSVKLHRALPGNTSVAVGWENALLWGGSDDKGSLYAVGTRIVPLRADVSRAFSVAVFTLGVGNGRFRFEEDDAEGNETVNVFGAVGLRVSDPVSLVADWTGQDLNVAASVTPIRRVPLVATAGLADLTGSAGDGIRFILSLGYGLAIRQPF